MQKAGGTENGRNSRHMDILWDPGRISLRGKAPALRRIRKDSCDLRCEGNQGGLEVRRWGVLGQQAKRLVVPDGRVPEREEGTRSQGGRAEARLGSFIAKQRVFCLILEVLGATELCLGYGGISLLCGKVPLTTAIARRQGD